MPPLQHLRKVLLPTSGQGRSHNVCRLTLAFPCKHIWGLYSGYTTTITNQCDHGFRSRGQPTICHIYWLLCTAAVMPREGRGVSQDKIEASLSLLALKRIPKGCNECTKGVLVVPYRSSLGCFGHRCRVSKTFLWSLKSVHSCNAAC